MRVLKYLPALLLLGLLPNLSFGAIIAGWNATSTTQGWISPTRINGAEQTVAAKNFVATDSTATSSFQKLFVTGPMTLIGEYITNLTSYIRGRVSATSPVTYDPSTGIIACPTCSVSAAGQTWEVINGYLTPTTTITTLHNNGLIATASSTFTSSFHLPSLSNGGLGVFGGTVTSAPTTTAGTGLTYTSNSFNVNTTQNITNLSNLTSNGVVYTAGSNGTLNTTATGTISNSGGITVTANQYIIGSGLTIGCSAASGSVTGCLSSTDWTTFNNKLGSYDAFTHPASGVSATTSELRMAGFVSTASSTIVGNATTTGTQSSGVASSTFAYFGSASVGTTSPAGRFAINPTAGDTNQFIVGSTTATSFIITPAGNVGIGTTQPTLVNANSHLTVAGISSQDIIASTTDNTTLSDAVVNVYAPGSRLFMGAHGTNQVSTRYGLTLGGWGEITAMDSSFNTTNGLVIGTNTATPFVLGTNNIEQARITSGGLLGLTTTTPWAKLSVGSASASTRFPLFVVASSSNAVSTTTNFVVNWNGNVGVGTATPFSVLSVGGAQAGTGSFFADNAGRSTSSVSFQTPYLTSDTICLTADTCRTTWPGGVNGSGSTNALTYWTNGTTIGATSSQPLYVGSIYGTSTILKSSFGASTTPWGFFSINPNGVGSGVPELVVGSSTKTDFVVDGNSRVGVGTSTPWTTFAVAGNGSIDYASTSAVSINGAGKVLDVNNSAATTTINGDTLFGGANGVNVWTNEGSSAVAPGSLNIGLSSSPLNGFSVTRVGGTDATFARFKTGASSDFVQFTSATGIQLDGRDTGLTSRFRLATAGDNYLDPSAGNVYFIPAAGSTAVGTSTPPTAWAFQVNGTRPFSVLSDSSAGTNLKHWFLASEGGNLYVGTSTDVYASTSISALEIAGTGFGTTTVRGLNISGQATSTSNIGFNLTGTGCLAQNGNCLVTTSPWTVTAGGGGYALSANNSAELGTGAGVSFVAYGGGFNSATSTAAPAQTATLASGRSGNSQASAGASVTIGSGGNITGSNDNNAANAGANISIGQGGNSANRTSDTAGAGSTVDIAQGGGGFNSGAAGNVTISAGGEGTNDGNDGTVNIGSPTGKKNVKVTINGHSTTTGYVYFTGIPLITGGETGALCWDSTGRVSENTINTCLLSSRRFKDNIDYLTSESTIDQLKPVTFTYKGSATVEYGLIAEDVAKVDPTLVAYEADGITPRTIRYEGVTALLVKKVQDQQQQIDQLKTQTGTTKSPWDYVPYLGLLGLLGLIKRNKV